MAMGRAASRFELTAEVSWSMSAVALKESMPLFLVGIPVSQTSMEVNGHHDFNAGTLFERGSDGLPTGS